MHGTARIQTAIKAMICGDVAGAITEGWSQEEIHAVFKDTEILSHDDWPSSVRGLPPYRRKTLNTFGLHGLQTQLFILMCQTIRQDSDDTAQFEHRLQSALDSAALRGRDQRLLTVAHARRRHEEPGPPQRSRQRGRVSIAAALFAAVSRESEAEAAQLAYALSESIYASKQVNAITAVASTILFRQLQAENGCKTSELFEPLLDAICSSRGEDRAHALSEWLYTDRAEMPSISDVRSIVKPVEDDLTALFVASVVALNQTPSSSKTVYESILRAGGSTLFPAIWVSLMLGLSAGDDALPNVALADDTVLGRAFSVFEARTLNVDCTLESELTRASNAWLDGIVAERRTR